MSSLDSVRAELVEQRQQLAGAIAYYSDEPLGPHGPAWESGYLGAFQYFSIRYPMTMVRPALTFRRAHVCRSCGVEFEKRPTRRQLFCSSCASLRNRKSGREYMRRVRENGQTAESRERATLARLKAKYEQS